MFTLYRISQSAKNSTWVNLNVTNIGQVSPNWPIFRNRDIVYAHLVSDTLWSGL